MTELVYLTETELAYTAGLLDGEGWVGIIHSGNRQGVQYHRLDVVVNMTDEAPIKWLHERFGGHMRSFEAKQENWKRVYRVQFQGRAAANLLAAVRPYLLVKAAQADLALEFISTSLARAGSRRLSGEVIATREGMKQQMHVLNARGVKHG